MAIKVKSTEIGKIEINAGYIIIASHPTIDGKAYIVLGVKPNQVEYVTWWSNDKGECYHGHYFPNTAFDEAIKDFQKRS